MRRGKNRKFGRERNLRRALYKSLATALIDHGKIKTTMAKAKSLSPFADKLITTAKKGGMASRRELTRTFHQKTVKKLMDEVAPRFSGPALQRTDASGKKDRSLSDRAGRKGGYTRVIKLGRRKSDGAEMALIEFTQ